MMTSILFALAGGALIGLAASLLLLFAGRIAGISGIVGRLLQRSADPGDLGWRVAFVVGLLAGGALVLAVLPEAIAPPPGRSALAVAIAGLLVGFGTRLGNGCTSGHGVCGLTRLSRRSLVATITFMLTGFATATAIGLLTGGPG